MTEHWSLYHKGLVDLKFHNSVDFHLDDKQNATNFQSVMEQRQIRVDVQLNDAQKQRIASSRDILQSVVKTIVLRGKQNYALRGNIRLFWKIQTQTMVTFLH